MQLRKRADGFTLVELLVAVVILGIITVPITNVIIGYLRNSDAITSRLLASHDAQIVSAYWAQDVASIGQRNAATHALLPSIQVPAMTADPKCTSAGTIATFTWDDYLNATDPATVVTVSYVVAYSPVSLQCELHRVRLTSPATNVVLAHYLDSVSPPSITCSTTCTAVPTANEKVTLNLTLADKGSPGGVWPVTLSGQRRGSS